MPASQFVKSATGGKGVVVAERNDGRSGDAWDVLDVTSRDQMDVAAHALALIQDGLRRTIPCGNPIYFQTVTAPEMDGTNGFTRCPTDLVRRTEYEDASGHHARYFRLASLFLVATILY